MTPSEMIASYLLEADSENEPQLDHYVKQLFRSPEPGYSTEKGVPREQRLTNSLDTAWSILDNQGRFIGGIYFDPQLDIPANASQKWKDLHYLADPRGKHAGVLMYFKSFDEAARYIIQRDQGKARDVIESTACLNEDDAA